MKQITIDQIDYSAKWTGYYWMSDKDRPTVLENALLDRTVLEPGVPFVIEAQLTSGSCSLSIRNVDGRCMIISYDAADLNDPNSKDETFISLRMGNLKLRFKRRWQEMPDVDNLCAGMPSLQPAGLMFVGFEPINKKGE